MFAFLKKLCIFLWFWLTPLLTLNVPPVQLQAKQSFSVLIVEMTALRGISAHCKLAAWVFTHNSGSARKTALLGIPARRKLAAWVFTKISSARRWSSAKKDNDGMPLV